MLAYLSRLGLSGSTTVHRYRSRGDLHAIRNGLGAASPEPDRRAS
jgi:hypothetical protein